MSRIDFSHLSAEERLELIEELWDSLDQGEALLTPAQKAELDRRMETLGEDIANGHDAAEVLAELRRRLG